MGQALDVSFDPVIAKFLPLYRLRGTRYVVLSGGRYGAKSWAVALALLYYACRYKVLILCTRMVQISIAQSSKKLIEDTIDRLGIRFEFTITDTYIRNNRTGAEFIFRGMQDIRSLEGVGLCWVEEAQYVGEKAGEELTKTIRLSNSTIIFTLNRIYKTDWVCEKFLSGNPPPNTKLIDVNITELPRSIIPDNIWDEFQDDMRRNEKKARHIWLGDYADEESRRIAPMYVVQEAWDRIQRPEGNHTLGLDLGGGRDLTVLTHKQGKYIHAQYEFSESDPQLLCSLVAQKIKSISPAGSVVNYDRTGLGWAVQPILKGLLPSYNIIGINFAEAPRNKSSGAKNRRAEMYMHAVDEMRAGMAIGNCKHDVIKELVSIECRETVGGLLILEPKDDLKKRIGCSPDHADSLVLACANANISEKTHVITPNTPVWRPSGSWMD